MLAELSPQNRETKVIRTPQVAIDDRGHVFAAWASENGRTTNVHVANSISVGYAARTLYVPPERQFGIEQFGIQQAGAGQVVLNWVNELGPTYAFAATAGRDGQWGAIHRGLVPFFSPVNLGIFTGFATDTAGNQALMYEQRESRLWMVHRAAGHAFGDPHQIGGPTDDATIAAGGQDTLLLAWVPHRRNTVIAGIGKTLERQRSTQRFEATTPNELHAAVDNGGRAILVWNAQYRGARGKSRSGIWLTTAETNGRFGQPIIVSNRHQNCAFQDSNPPIVQSPNGHTLISWTCGPEEHQTRYMARYTL